MADNVIEFSLKARDQMTRAFGSARLGIKRLATGVAAFGAVGGLAAKSIVAVGSANENMRVRLNATLGSVKEGGRAFEEMAKFASTVPFAYEDIMQSATNLAGVLDNGVDDIQRYMPIIADLATVSGLSIEETTSQVIKMYSGGAAAADSFRDRGISAMLGFQSGVSYTAEETRKQLIAAFEDPQSKFRGASLAMATTWDGVLSMIGDKWRAFKVQVSDAGLFNYIKAIAINIDKAMGGALENSATHAEVLSNVLISGLQHVMDGVALVSTAFHGWQLIWAGLKVAFTSFVAANVEGIYAIVEGVRALANIIPGVNLEKFEAMHRIFLETQRDAALAKSALNGLIIEPTTAESIKQFKADVNATYLELENMAVETQRNIQQTTETTKEGIATLTQAMNDQYNDFQDNLAVNSESFAQSFFNTVGGAVDGMAQGMAEVVTAGGDMVKSMQKLGGRVLTSLVGILIKMGLQRLIFSQLDTSATAKEAAQKGAKAVGLAAANGVASMAAAPFPINLTAPAFGAAMGATSAAQLTAGMATGASIGAGVAGIAHGGLTNVPAESTYLLNKGERVLSPNQNRDLTNALAGGGGGLGSVAIDTVQVNVLPNATNADALLSMSASEIEAVVAGPILDALNNLNRKGINPDFVERG